MRFNAILLGAVVFQAMACPVLSSFEQDVVSVANGDSNLRGRRLDKAEDKQKEIEQLEAEIAEWEVKVAEIREKCLPLTIANEEAKAAYDAADDTFDEENEECKKFNTGETPYDEAVAQKRAEFQAFNRGATEYDEKIAEIQALYDEANKEWKEANGSAKNELKVTRDAIKKDLDLAKKEKSEAKDLAKQAKKEAEDGWKAARNACNKDKNEANSAANEKKAIWNQAKKDANQCQKDLKKAAKTLTNKRNKTSRKQKSLEKLKKRQKNKKQRKQKSKAEVKKELVAGQCVADHVCATIRGDPHITTFDGLKYDCQGEGEFVLAKTINSDNYFEIQARFTSIGKDRMVSITTAVSITTGVIGEPDVDIFTEKVDGECALYYFVDGQPTDFTTPVSGISFEDGEGSSDTSDYLFFTGSGIMYSVYAKNGNFGCVINSKLCLPPSMVEKEDIVGLLGTPDGLIKNEWTTPTGAELSQSNTDKATAYAMCTKNWCVRKAEDSVFGYLPGTQWADFYNCDAPYDSSGDVVLLDPPDECVVCCSDHPVVEMYDECIEECSMANEGFGTEQCVIDIEDSVVLATVEKKCKDPVIPDEPLEERTISFPAPPKDAPTPAPAPSPASGSGDPHFKTWSGDKFDYHGECDLVLVQNPDFASGMGLHIHIRTTRVKYFSYIESIAIMIGGKVLEFNNDVANFKISGKPVEPIRKYHETKIAGFVIRRDPKAISIRLDAESGARIDLIQRSNGFPAVVLDGGDDQILFKGSLGLLGDWETGKRLARDGKTEMMDEDATEFALEWQVRDTDPKLFWTPRFPQWPTQCLPPKKMLGNRLGLSHMKAEAEKACSHWKDDMDDCIFDVIATRNVLVAAEGSVTSM